MQNRPTTGPAVSSASGQKASNRARAVMAHIPWYTIEGASRLAADAGVGRSTISRLLRGQRSPSLRLAASVTAALSKRLGRELPIEEIFCRDGSNTYPTASTCALCLGACVGCFPDEAYDRRGAMKPEYSDMAPGDWCRYPRRDDPATLTCSESNH